MSGGKLPPISFYTRREKTVIGLKLQQSVYLPNGSPKVSYGQSLYYNRVRNNVFLPDEGSKSSRKLSKSYLAARENVHRKYNLSGKPQDMSSIQLDDHKSHISIQSGKLLYRNIPHGIALRRDDSKLVMKCRSPVKGKTVPQTAPTKYAQMHKLGLEETLAVNSKVSRDTDVQPSSEKAGFKDTIQHTGDSDDKNVTKRNVTQTFRLETKSDKTCIYPVQFQPKGLPDTNHVEHEQTKYPNVAITGQDTDTDTPRTRAVNKSEHVSLAKVELGKQLNGVIPTISKSKSENRNLYPIFDWNQQKKEDLMRVRFLDPVLRNYDEKHNDHYGLPGYKRLSCDHNRTFTRQSYDDIYRFVPDKLNIELDWKLINEYRRRVRKSSEGEPRSRSPSFSPLLNPPPTAMEFNITDLETLLEEERPQSHSLSGLVPETVGTADNNRHTEAGVTINTVTSTLVTETDSGNPAINGIACKPVSTALVLSEKTRVSETSVKPNITTAELPTDEICLQETDQSYVTASPTRKSTDTETEININESQQHQQNDVPNPKTILPETSEVCNQVIPEEQPIQVVVKVIPSIVEDHPPEDDESFVNAPNEAYSSVTGKKHLLSKPSSTFLAVPRIDVSFEGRWPNKESSPREKKLSSSRIGSTFGSSEMNTSVSIRNDGTVLEDTVSPRSQQNINSRKSVPSKNIVFVSPAVEPNVTNV